MNIEDTNKISNLDKLDSECNFKILELEGIDFDDDWSKLSKLKNLETLILKDSYINFKRCSLSRFVCRQSVLSVLSFAFFLVLYYIMCM